MSVINVDISEINSARQLVDEYVQYQTDGMSEATSKMNAMHDSWTGKDYTKYKSAWDSVLTNSSVASTVKTELESFSQYLNRCYTEYSNMKDTIISISNSLW